ncbi:MAG: hypothetical protein ACRD21_05730, partial [Vicinamibacteria bacterium]
MIVDALVVVAPCALGLEQPSAGGRVSLENRVHREIVELYHASALGRGAVLALLLVKAHAAF